MCLEDKQSYIIEIEKDLQKINFGERISIGKEFDSPVGEFVGTFQNKYGTCVALRDKERMHHYVIPNDKTFEKKFNSFIIMSL